MIKKRPPTILDNVALPSMHSAQEEKPDATGTSCHTCSDLADEEDGAKTCNDAVVRYQPEPLTKEELDFFLSLDFKADNDDNSMAVGSTCAPFPLDTVLVGFGNCSANGLQDSTSTLQSNISSLSTATTSVGGYHPHQSFSTLQTSSSCGSTFRDEVANQVQGQKIKLISTMKRSAESREAVQHLVRNFPQTPMRNASFDIDTLATHYNRDAPRPPESSMHKNDKKRKHEALTTEKDADSKEVRRHSVFDFSI